MATQTITRQTPLAEQPATATIDPQPDRRDVPAHREPSRSPSTARPHQPASPALPSQRPRGHVIGHALGEPAPLTVDGRPRGHVIGHALDEPAPPSLDGRPRGHVIGHALGERPLSEPTYTGADWPDTEVRLGRGSGHR